MPLWKMGLSKEASISDTMKYIITYFKQLNNIQMCIKTTYVAPYKHRTIQGLGGAWVDFVHMVY